jgi:hypothetical protein
VKAVRELWYLVRFFQVVPPVPSLLKTTFAVVAVASAAAIINDVHAAAGALVPVLLLQAFAASSGFALPARRGHYDLLFTTGNSRTSIAIVHWASSVAAGVATWLALGVVEVLVSDGYRSTLFASGTCVSMCVVSTLPWATGVALPRFATGIGWLLLTTTLASTFASPVTGEWTVFSSRIEDLAWPAWAFFVYPLGAVGRHLSAPQFMAVVPTLVIAIGSMVIACQWIAQRDVPLEASQ